MTSRCIGEPVSWLRLEQFRLGELDGAERTRVAEHLAACPVCAACSARIEADEAIELPALELRAGVIPPSVAAPRRPARSLRLVAGVGAVAAAACVALLIRRTPRAPDEALGHGETARSKGGGMAFVLVRDDGQRIVEAQGVFRSSDRFKALVTCPPEASATFDLVVFDASGSSFPLAPARGFPCGNEVPLPGAFRLTPSPGGTETVCVVWGGDGEVDRTALSRSRVAGPRSICKELRTAGD